MTQRIDTQTSIERQTLRQPLKTKGVPGKGASGMVRKHIQDQVLRHID
jgi:hypothetical protein